LELQHRGAIDSPDLLLPAFHARAFSPRQRAVKSIPLALFVPAPQNPFPTQSRKQQQSRKHPVRHDAEGGSSSGGAEGAAVSHATEGGSSGGGCTGADARLRKAATVGRKGVPTAAPSTEDPHASIRRLSVQWPVRRRINLVAVNLLLLS